MANNKERERGQTSTVFVISLVIIIGAFTLLIDGGRYLVMRNRTRMIADASALSGASMLDIEKAQKGNFVLMPGKDKLSARGRATEVFIDNKANSPEWANFQLNEVIVQGNEIWVTVTGTSAPLFGSQWGLRYSTTVASSARAAVGISSER